MNIAMILSGGVGKRFGANVPKQYLHINGKMVIQYVLEALRSSQKIDRIVVVAHEPYAEMLRTKFNVDICLGGTERNITLKNGLDYIREHYDCKKIILLDAVRPMVTAELVDDYIHKLEHNDIVLTAQTITDSLGCYDMHEVRRERYYLLQSPEAYRFDALYQYFDSKSTLTEVAQQLPQTMRTHLNFGFSDNLKITYKQDLFLAEQMLGLQEIKSKFEVKRLKEYLGKNYSVEAEQWINELPEVIDCLKFKWKFDEYELNKNAHFGIVIKAESCRWGKIVVKIVPPFIGRFRQEVDIYNQYAGKGIMCPLLDYDNAFSAMLLKQAEPAHFAEFKEENFPKIEEFFDRLSQNLIACQHGKNDYAKILREKINQTSEGLVYGAEIDAYVKKAVAVYDKALLKEPTYMILGDVHQYNLIEDQGRYIAIDPIGYIAPKEIEYARFIGTILTEDLDCAEMKLNQAITLFSKYTTKQKLLDALFVDVTFRLHNTTFENSDEILAKKWLKVIEVIKKIKICVDKN